MSEEAVASSASRLEYLARTLDHFTESDMLVLVDVTPGTLEAWRKRGEGPDYVRAGNRYLYPKASVAAWMQARVKTRDRVPAREAL